MRFIRSLFVALVFATVISTVVPPAHTAPVGPLPDSTGILTSWRLEPVSPCVQDSIYMIVRGFVATPCDSFLGAEAIDSLHVRIRTQVYADRMCFAPPLVFYPVPVGLGRFAAGSHAGIVDVVTAYVREDGSATRMVQQFRFEFVVSPDCPTPPPPTPPPLPFVNAIFTDPPHPCAERPTSLVMEGAFLDGCGQVVDAAVHDPQHVEITLQLHTLEQRGCTDELKPWRQAFDLGPLPSGGHRTDVTLHVVDVDSTHTSLVRSTYYGSHEFFVFGDCDSVPPPLPGPLPYVTGIVVGRGPCELGPVCPQDSILVQVWGVFPSDCFIFRGIELLPSLIVGPLPEPPIVRLIVDDTGCLKRPCLDVLVPWAATVKLPPLPARGYNLMVELAQVSCSDSYPPGQLFRTSVPFAVSESCAVLPPCLVTDFAPGPGNVTACNATISPTHPAELTFRVRPTVALAGLQGSFRLDPPGLRISRLEPIGSAVGMLLNWSATVDGARFVLFAEHGAPIPPIPPPDASSAVYPEAWPVLRVIVEDLGRVAIPERTVLTVVDQLGSDIDGNAVPICPPPPCVRVGPASPPPAGSAFDPRINAGRALICAEHACDFNADGFEDIRDLVTMVHCVNGEGPCPPDVGTRFDCDGDGTYALPDVICCARHVLLLPPCPECPPDTGQVRPEPGVALSFGTPVETVGGVDLPLRIRGADRVGAAMLTFDAPLDRYDLAGVLGETGGRWLVLHEVRAGRIVLGLVSVRSSRDLALLVPDLDLTLRLALRPGETPGGEVSAVGGEFSGGDGVRLAVNLGHPSQGLPGPARLALSGGRPNPFSSETRFTLELVEPADVVVGIYDLRGRLMTTLFRGRLTSGPREFRWDGRRADGTAASHGVYFYQVSVGGKTLARKLILMRGD